MKHNSFFFLLLLLLALVTLPGQAAPAETPGEHPNDILIVANKGVSVDEVSLKELKSIFLKKRSSWKGGGKVVAVHAKVGTEIRDDFVAKVLGLDHIGEQSYWQEVMVKAAVKPPPAFSNPLKAVFNLRGSVGYVYRADYKAGVAKILFVIPRRKESDPSD